MQDDLHNKTNTHIRKINLIGIDDFNEKKKKNVEINKTIFTLYKYNKKYLVQFSI